MRIALVAGLRLSILIGALSALTCASQPPPAPVAPVPPGPPATKAAEPLPPARAEQLWSSAERVFHTRCAVCHGCYDAPCQLKLDSFAGIARGANPQPVYDGGRLTAADPTRLFSDAHSPAEWRRKGFHPVLAEAASADPQASLLLRMLELKRAHPLPVREPLDANLTFELDRKQVCTKAEDFDRFAKEHPLWGMPYGMAALTAGEHEALRAWVVAGAPPPEEAPLSPALQGAVERFERFLAQPGAKAQLMARYLYEHLFLASLYFDDVDETPRRFFRVVRSRTPHGSKVDEIPTRRPFDDPGPGRVYYRLVARSGPSLSKTQMPYALSDARLERYRELFLAPDYSVDTLPSYEPAVGADPFRAFSAIPSHTRYRFLLDDAWYFLSAFIKGPVCRGQVALNVIQERFWILFVSPNVPWGSDSARFLQEIKGDLDLPAEAGSNAWLTGWLRYSRQHQRYVQRKNAFLEEVSYDGRDLTLDAIWDGDGHNPNAALTVLRHFDSATVVKGLIGGPPKTAWVMDFPQLERIYYLLVAGFDVFGNVGHQLATRLYMDFLRMEGEANFLSLLPAATRGMLVKRWYRGLSGERQKSVWSELLTFPGFARIRYRTNRPNLELYDLLAQRVAKVRSRSYDLEGGQGLEAGLVEALKQLARVSGLPASNMPEAAFLTVRSPAGDTHFTVLRDSAHTNVAQLFFEERRRLPEEDGLTVVRGFLGAYPNVLFEVQRAQLEEFVGAVSTLRDDDGYRALRRKFGVSRTDPYFWQHSDRLHRAYREQVPLEAGLFDYNRLEAF